MGIEFAAQVAEHARNLAILMQSPEPGMPAWAGMVRDDAQWLSDWWAGKFDLPGTPMAPPAPVPCDLKFFEIRDSMTMIPAMAVKLPMNPATRTAGYGPDTVYIQLTHLQHGEARVDPFNWNAARGRTMPMAHRWLVEHWDEIKTGDVLDVQFISGETQGKKSAELRGWKGGDS